MSRKTENAPVEPYTEYTHARFRCSRCGTSVLRARSRAEGICVRCEEAD